MGKRRWRSILLTAAGALLGFAFLHPYSMAVCSLYGGHAGGSEARSLLEYAAAAFRPVMVAMGLPFGLLGGATGLSLGLWLEGRDRRVEFEIRMAEAEAVKSLMVTLAHHLLNAAQVVGGFAGVCLRRERDEQIQRHLEVIQTEAHRVEAVVHALQAVETAAVEPYVAGSDARMIDIREELERRLLAGNVAGPVSSGLDGVDDAPVTP